MDPEITHDAAEAENPPAQDLLPEEKASRRISGWTLWVRDLLFSAAASLLIITFLYQPVRVEGTSMLPRLEDQDRLFINKFVYRFSAVEHGDVVVFHYPLDQQKSYIKRIIAVPGDNLRIDRGQVYVNGKPLNEPYIPEEFRDVRSYDAIVIPKDEFFVMGDHRSISSDSREFGPVKRDLIYGKAAFVYWPRQDVGVVH
jgi:signal peptidase I